jgi:mitochondrial fusion and transport protein UGO1
MSEVSYKKRKTDTSIHRRPVSKKVRRQEAYSSGSSESEGDGEFIARDAPSQDPTKAKAKIQKKSVRPNGPSSTNGDLENLDESAVPANEDSEVVSKHSATEDSEASADESSDITSDDEGEEGSTRKKTKRRDPEVFANSLAAILSSKLPTSKRQDPVLARSKDAEEAYHEINEGRLETKAKRKLQEEKRRAKERGRVKNVLLGERGAEAALDPEHPEANDSTLSAADIAEQERRLRKTAQRGVVKLFNAVRAAQVRSEQAGRAMRTKGVIGHQHREEKVGEMGRQAFLDMVGGGGKTKS